MTEPGDAWIQVRLGRVPERFRATLVAALGPSSGSIPELVADSRALLARASASSERDAAFELLAADGLLTWACERAAETEDPGRSLKRIAHELRGAAP